MLCDRASQRIKLPEQAVSGSSFLVRSERAIFKPRNQKLETRILRLDDGAEDREQEVVELNSKCLWG